MYLNFELRDNGSLSRGQMSSRSVRPCQRRHEHDEREGEREDRQEQKEGRGTLRYTARANASGLARACALFS